MKIWKDTCPVKEEYTVEYESVRKGMYIDDLIDFSSLHIRNRCRLGSFHCIYVGQAVNEKSDLNVEQV